MVQWNHFFLVPVSIPILHLCLLLVFQKPVNDVYLYTKNYEYNNKSVFFNLFICFISQIEYCKTIICTLPYFYSILIKKRILHPFIKFFYDFNCINCFLFIHNWTFNPSFFYTLLYMIILIYKF